MAASERVEAAFGVAVAAGLVRSQLSLGSIGCFLLQLLRCSLLYVMLLGELCMYVCQGMYYICELFSTFSFFFKPLCSNLKSRSITLKINCTMSMGRLSFVS